MIYNGQTMNDFADESLDRPLCLQTTLRIMGDKWTALILNALADGPMTFSCLETELKSISPRTLSHRLDMLIDENILDKRQYCEHPPRCKYSITPKGLELQDIIAKMAEWGGKYAKPAVDAQHLPTGQAGQ